MVHISIIEARLSKLGVRPSQWFMPEIRELEHTLMDNEEIVAVVPGRYFAGFALLIATDVRLLLIDKRTFFMSLEDIRYDMISEVAFNSRVIEATVHIFSVNKQHRFSSIKYRNQLKSLTNYVQQRVMEIRQHQVVSQGILPVSRRPVANQFFSRPTYVRPALMAQKINRSYHHIAHFMGAAAVRSANHHYSMPNPYSNISLVTRSSVFGDTTTSY